ncbi:hypothetical protein DICSQDRAFT_155699 [Dichomitus squalens LYAD-421 SS1]|uniref:TRIP4/RQT4 C2HC5-type zinc finger domain-containing protein n=1 Tax=Dichomitus squalens (strain LYAD-421) TaxID=732165 RepID=R7T023_DICSQ|nr:uncharacterized protein DICSQDRAFT_155699 [Dichomitus squalens LYAD-421 SS1]EJF60567.1 hypothetical protein DICSQDRAFT_155699 [Dichomitus squalens LYAD-421 SS1]
MHKTAWTQKGSSLPSERIPSKKQAPQPTKAKGKQKDAGPPKSKEVVKLEKLRDDLRNATGKERDPKRGCFCQARLHPLSSYTPICRTCGLILCELNLPNFACPHCGESTLLPAARNALIATLDAQISEAIAKEEEGRARAIQEARAAEGAFPTLSAASRASTPGSGSDSQASHPVNQTHKVLSLNSKTRKIKVESYTPPAISRAASAERVKQAEPEHKRVPAPPAEVVISRTQPDPQRPWTNTRGLNVTYVPPSRI